MVEQSPEKACVGGSIPSLATTLMKSKKFKSKNELFFN